MDRSDLTEILINIGNYYIAACRTIPSNSIKLNKPGRLAFVIHTNLELQLYFAVLEGFFLQLLLMTCSEGALKMRNTQKYYIYYQIEIRSIVNWIS